MTNLKTLSVSELHQQIKNATDELIAREKKSVDKPTDIEQFKTEKRNARVGEKVLITNPDEINKEEVGEIFTVAVEGAFGIHVEEIRKASIGWTFCNREYEVIIEKTPVIELQEAPPKTKNQQRAEINQRAREFVEDSFHKVGSVTGRKGYNSPTSLIALCDAEFIVNPEKRTVVCLLRAQIGRNVTDKGIAKCNPSDVFNSWIGKAIALARALMIDIPREFLNAVQPDEIVVGMEVKNTGRAGGIHKVERISMNGKHIHIGRSEQYFTCGYAKIINDTNAIYEEVS